MAASFVKTIVKTLMPHGVVSWLRKIRFGAEPDSYYSFRTNPTCRVKGWMEPAHVEIELDINDWIQRQIFQTGMYEAASVRKLEELMPPGGVFFDVGSNIGVYSLNLFRKAKSVFAFEATKTTYDCLLKTISENGIDNVHPCFYAVDSKDGAEVTIYAGNHSQALGNIGANSMHFGQTVANKVKTITLDTFVREKGVPGIDLIKIDIEGNELHALKGGLQSIRKFRPIIFCEINPDLNAKAGYSAEALFDFIADELNYKAKILSGNSLRPVGRKRAVSQQQNIFFFPP